jgi:threonine dehydrogenase-like Zn-dependent dehydrogenase
MAAHSAIIKGASQVIVADRHQDRLRLAEEIGAIAVDESKGAHVDNILELTDGEGADRGCECVGYQCHDPAGREVPNITMNDLVKSVRPTGAIGIVGVFVPEDPKGADELARKGQIAFDIGTFFEKGLHMGSGEANVH